MGRSIAALPIPFQPNITDSGKESLESSLSVWNTSDMFCTRFPVAVSVTYHLFYSLVTEQMP